MNWKSNLGCYVLGAATMTIGGIFYIDYRIQEMESKYHSLIEQQTEKVNTTIKDSAGQINENLEKKVDSELNKVKKLFGIEDKPE